MHLSEPLRIGPLTFENRLIQGPLAGFSCAPMRERFYDYQPPAYCVTEMVSAVDVLTKHSPNSRYLYKSPKEKYTAYQLSGTDPHVLADASAVLQHHGADLIDLNCGCPKTKIRKKGGGSALLENTTLLFALVRAIKEKITCPLTVKIRLHPEVDKTLYLAQGLEEMGADALIVHGRDWRMGYDVNARYDPIANIKAHLSIPVILNGDIRCHASLEKAMATGCDGYMISRAGMGRPWLYEALLQGGPLERDEATLYKIFMQHLFALSELENPHLALLQSKTIVKYYFRHLRQDTFLQGYYALSAFDEIGPYLRRYLSLYSNLHNASPAIDG